jgi:hypothetical protein
MVKAVGMHAEIVIDAIRYYFEHWRTIWFACSRDTWKGPPESRRCEFTIHSIEKNLQELLSKMHSHAQRKEPQTWSTSSLTTDDLKPITEEGRQQLQRLASEFRNRVQAMPEPAAAIKSGAHGQRFAGNRGRVEAH